MRPPPDPDPSAEPQLENDDAQARTAPAPSPRGGAAQRTDQAESNQMWGGRFREPTDALVQRFNASIDVDRALAFDDIAGSIAHARMLGEQGILSSAEAEQIIAGLEQIRSEIESGTFAWRVDLEDVHMNIEHALIARIGPVGGKLHTGRSRNDQVATDFRLWLKRHTHELLGLLHELRRVLLELAERHLEVIMPGYTHLQVAQPIRFSHHLLAYAEMFGRDQGRLRDSLARLDVSPLGAGALAGTTFPIDRQRTAELLGFAAVAANSLDAVSDRDFALEFLAAASIAMMHLSRLSEELILWSSPGFGFVTLPDAFTTGSSIMPQKKNPDVSELIRGKSGRVFGALMGLLTVMKGLPLAYNKDMQEDKEGVFDATETLRTSLRLMVEMLPRIAVHGERMRQAAADAYSNATDLADELSRRGLPFREAHEVVGRLVAYALEQGRPLDALSLDEMRRHGGVAGRPEAETLFDEGIYRVLALEQVVDGRRSLGGTARERVEEQLRRLRAELDAAEHDPGGHA